MFNCAQPAHCSAHARDAPLIEEDGRPPVAPLRPRAGCWTARPVTMPLPRSAGPVRLSRGRR